MSCNNDYLPLDPCNPCSENTECDVPAYDTTGCLYTQGSECISYDTDVPCLGFTKGKLSTLLQKLIAYVLTIFTRVKSDSLTVTREGVCSDELRIELDPSADADNILSLGSDGKPFVPSTDVVIHDAQYISWDKTIIDNVIHFTPSIDLAALAAAVCTICADSVEACAAPAGLAVATELYNEGEEPSIIVYSNASVTWTEIAGVTYDVVLDDVTLQAGATSPYVIDTLDPDTTYTVKIISYCPQGGSGESQLTFETPTETACGAPTNLIVT